MPRSMGKKIKRVISLGVINHFLSMPRFFGMKRGLLRLADVAIGDHSKVVGPIRIGTEIDLTIGDNCWVGKNFFIDGNGQVTIGDNCDIGPQVTCSTGGHLIGDSERRAGTGESYSITIGHGVWLCTHVVICGEVSVGESCVVAAGAVVVSDVCANVLAGGVPAHMIKRL